MRPAKYSLNQELTNDVSLEYNNTIQQLLFEKLFTNMNYEIVGSEKQDKDITVVTVSVENIDTKKVFVNTFKNMFQNTFSNSGRTINVEEEFKKILESEEAPKSKNTTKFFVVKTKEGNKIDVTAENVDVLFGKINSTLSNLDKLGEEESEGVNSGADSTEINNTGNKQNIQNTQTSSENQNSQKKENKSEKKEGPKAGTDQKLTEPTLNKK